MSSTLFVEYRSNGFWAYDVAVGILLKHVIDHAEKLAAQENDAWLHDCVEHWRVNAVISDFGLHLDEDWSGSQIQIVWQLFDDACNDLLKRGSIPAEEMLAWKVLDGDGVFPRGASQFPTAPVVELGRSIQSLLEGTLPEAPDGRHWFFGIEAGRDVI